jgi:hypothetical protein
MRPRLFMNFSGDYNDDDELQTLRSTFQNKVCTALLISGIRNTLFFAFLRPSLSKFPFH